MTQDEKDIELYKASLPAFFTNELEADKTILGLSVAAIGFYMALFLNKDLQVTEPMFITIIIALTSFLIVSSMILAIFIQNKKQLLHIVETTGGIEEDALLEFLDKWKYLPFAIGILFSIIFTLSLMYSKINDKGHTMSQDGNQTNVSQNHDHNISEGFSNIINVNIAKGNAGITTANHPHRDNHATRNTDVIINNTQQTNSPSDNNCTPTVSTEVDINE